MSQFAKRPMMVHQHSAICQAKDIPQRPGLTIHATTLINSMSAFFQRGAYTDVSLIVEDIQIPCHKLILIAMSPYFASIFPPKNPEKHPTEVPLYEMTPDIILAILGYMYTGEIALDEKNATEVLITADLFQMSHLKDLAEATLTTTLREDNVFKLFQLTGVVECSTLSCAIRKSFVTVDNMFRILGLATKNKNQEMATIAKKMICQTRDSLKFYSMLEMRKDLFMELLRCEALRARSEEVIFESVMRWIGFDLEHRQTMLTDLLKCVRFPLIDAMYYAEHVRGNELIKNDFFAQQHLEMVTCVQTVLESEVSLRPRPGMLPRPPAGAVIVRLVDKRTTADWDVATLFCPEDGVRYPLGPLIQDGSSVKHATVSDENKLFVGTFCGRTGYKLQMLDLAKGYAWEEKASLTHRCVGLFADGNHIFGVSHYPHPCLYIYSIARNKWSDQAVYLPPEVGDDHRFAYVVFHGMFYVFHHAKSHRYDIRRKVWLELPVCPFKLSFSEDTRVVCHHGIIFIIGDRSPYIELFDSKAMKWLPNRLQMPTPRQDILHLFTYSGFIYAFDKLSENMFSLVYDEESSTDQWKHVKWEWPNIRGCAVVGYVKNGSMLRQIIRGKFKTAWIPMVEMMSQAEYDRLYNIPHSG